MKRGIISSAKNVYFSSNFSSKILAPPAARLDEVLGVECEGLLLLGCGDDAIGKVGMGTLNDAGG